MVKDKVEDILNVGIPTYNNIELNVTSLTANAHNDYSSTIDAERHMFDEATKRVEATTGLSKEDKLDNILSNILFHSNITNSKSNIYIDNKEKKLNLFRNLIDLHNYENNTDIEISNRLKQYDSIRNYVQNNSYTTQMHNYLKDNYYRVYYARRYGDDLRTYLNVVDRYYNELLNHQDDINNIDLSDLISEYIEYLDIDKLVNQILLSDINITKKFLNKNYIMLNNTSF